MRPTPVYVIGLARNNLLTADKKSMFDDVTTTSENLIKITSLPKKNALYCFVISLWVALNLCAISVVIILGV